MDREKKAGQTTPGVTPAELPRFAAGRKGVLSLLDAIIRTLWQSDDRGEWPTMSLIDVNARVSKMLGYEVPSSSIRSTVYNHLDLFTKSASPGIRVRYSLSAKVRVRATKT